MSYTAPTGPIWGHSINTLLDGSYVGTFDSITVAAWPTANLAIYVPVYVRKRATVTALWYGNNGTGSSDYDIGLYDSAGVALLRKGSTAVSASIQEIVWDCTDTTIGPGWYYLAMSTNSNVMSHLCATPAAPQAAAHGIYSEASAFALPATATFAIPQTLAVIPVIGMFLNTLVS